MGNTVGWNIVGRMCRFKEPTIESAVMLGYSTARGVSSHVVQGSTVLDLQVSNEYIFSVFGTYCTENVYLKFKFTCVSCTFSGSLTSEMQLLSSFHEDLHISRFKLHKGEASSLSDSKTFHGLTGTARMPHFCEDFLLNHVPPFPLSSPLIVFYFPNFLYILLFVSLSLPPLPLKRGATQGQGLYLDSFPHYPQYSFTCTWGVVCTRNVCEWVTDLT